MQTWASALLHDKREESCLASILGCQNDFLFSTLPAVQTPIMTRGLCTNKIYWASRRCSCQRSSQRSTEIGWACSLQRSSRRRQGTLFLCPILPKSCDFLPLSVQMLRGTLELPMLRSSALKAERIKNQNVRQSATAWFCVCVGALGQLSTTGKSWSNDQPTRDTERARQHEASTSTRPSKGQRWIVKLSGWIVKLPGRIVKLPGRIVKLGLWNFPDGLWN